MKNKKILISIILISLFFGVINFVYFENINRYRDDKYMDTTNYKNFEKYIKDLYTNNINYNEDIINSLLIDNFYEARNELRNLASSTYKNKDGLISAIDNKSEMKQVFVKGSFEEFLYKKNKGESIMFNNQKISNEGDLYVVIRYILKTNNKEILYPYLDYIINYSSKKLQKNPRYDSLKYAIESIKYSNSDNLPTKEERLKRFINHFHLVFSYDIETRKKECLDNKECLEITDGLKDDGDNWFISIMSKEIKEEDSTLGQIIYNKYKASDMYPLLNIAFIKVAIDRYLGNPEKGISTLNEVEKLGITNNKGDSVDLGNYFYYFHRGVTEFELQNYQESLLLLEKQREFYPLYSYLEMYYLGIKSIINGKENNTILWGTYNY